MSATSVLIVFATRHGHARRIAEHVAAELRVRDVATEVHDAREKPTVDFARHDAAILVGSVSCGRHETELVQFVKSHRDALERTPSAFLSVSLSEAGAEDAHATPESRAKAHADAEGMAAKFFEATGWKPRATKLVAGALLYTRYNFIVRFVMKKIAASQGAPTDVKHDHEFTDWAALDRFVDEFLASVLPARASSPGA